MTSKNIFRAGLVALALAGCTGSQNSRVLNSPIQEDPMQYRNSGGCGELSRSMRALWTEHVVWTRLYIIAAVGDQPDADAAATRLMANQEQIGRAIAPYYGEVSAVKLTSLLHDHILIAMDVVKAARSKDQGALLNANLRWHENAEDIANFLANRNPNWRREEMVRMMNEHLERTTNEATARLAQDWDADVETFDLVFEQALKMADMMTEGIVKQFPDKFRN